MKIGVIGLGSIGGRHLKNLVDIGHEVYGYDIEAKNIPTIGWRPEYAKKLDAVVICSPTSEHAKHVADCVGTPTFVEKPIWGADFGNTTLDLSHIKMVGYNLRFHPCVIKAKEWLDAGDIGKPVWANFTLGQRSIKPPYLRDGVILNWSHEIDLCLYLLGGWGSLSSSTRIDNGRDVLTDILIRHSANLQSVVHLDYLTEPEVRQTIIVGKKATIILDLVNHGAWLRDKDGDILEHTQSNGWDATYIDEMQAFIDRIDGKQTIGATAEDGLAALNVCLEVRKQAGL
jgi:predicted dehydrogenase